MKKEVIRYSVAFALVWLVSAGAPSASARQSADEVEGLIKKLDDKDEKTALRAALALVKIGPSVVPVLNERMKEDRGCRFQFIASGIVYKIDGRKEAANPVLADVALGRCKGSSESDLKLRRQAAFILATRAEGIPVVARMLKDGETFARRSAAFAFDELTEKLQGARPDSIEATPEILAAAKAALPLLAQALDDRDEVVRCMSFEAMGQAGRTPHAELSAEARRLMQGVTPRCPK